MSATGNALVEAVEFLMVTRGIPTNDAAEFAAAQFEIMAGEDMSTGYICKRCGNPAPLGVGYAAPFGGAICAGLAACACGYSQRPAGPGAAS